MNVREPSRNSSAKKQTDIQIVEAHNHAVLAAETAVKLTKCHCPFGNHRLELPNSTLVQVHSPNRDHSQHPTNLEGGSKEVSIRGAQWQEIRLEQNTPRTPWVAGTQLLTVLGPEHVPVPRHRYMVRWTVHAPLPRDVLPKPEDGILHEQRDVQIVPDARSHAINLRRQPHNHGGHGSH